ESSGGSGGSGGSSGSLSSVLSVGNVSAGNDIILNGGSDLVLATGSKIYSQTNLLEFDDSVLISGDARITGIVDEINGARFDSQASRPVSVASNEGLIWVRTSDKKLIFTDDNTTDYVLNPSPASWNTVLNVSADSGSVSPRISSTAVLLFQQRSVNPSAVPNHGQLWVKNDSPTSLIFTDSAGNHHDILAAGGLSAPNDPNDDNKLVYASDGDLTYASQILTDGTYLSIGSSPASTGAIRLASG